MRAAAQLFSERGFQGTSLDDIATSLGVTKPTLYHYIANKEEILFACAQLGVEVLRHNLETSLAQGLASRERLQAAMCSFADFVTSEHGLCVIRVGEEPLSEARRRDLRAIKGRIEAEFRALIGKCMDEGSVARGDAASAAYNVVGAISAIGRWYRPNDHSPMSLQQAVAHCINMLMHGVLDVPASSAPLRAELPASNPAIRRERHFGSRVMNCFVNRPPHLAHMLAEALRLSPDGDALVCESLRLSWRELHHAATKCAAGLVASGIQPGDRVALYMGNCPEFVIAMLGCAWMGAVVVPIGVRAGSAEVAHTLLDSGALAVVCDPDMLSHLPAMAALPDLRLRFSLGGQAVAGVESFGTLMRAAPMAQPHDAAEEDVAVLLYTSGTTGHPKGSMVTQLNIAHSVMHFASANQINGDSRVALAVPVLHATGLIAQLFTGLYARCCVVLMRHFRASDFVGLVAKERITHTIMVPAMYNMCLLLPDLTAHDLSSWRFGAFGGAPMPTATIDELAARLPGLTLMNAYGATETSSPATIMPAGHTPGRRDSVGLPVTCGEIFVADEQGRELPRGEVGELWVAGPMVVPGYWGNPAATDSEFCGGYWRSGDIGCQDAEGYIRILDRKKDVINRGGYKIYGVAVENALAEHPQVVESALVGVPCPVLGERVHAHVCVRQLDHSTQVAALTSFCAERVADYAIPETWTIGTEPLPRNPNGKVMKRLLRESLHPALN